MLIRFCLPFLLICGLATSLTAQATSCADLAKKHLATLDKHLDLDFKQMKCLKEVSTRFCSSNKANPPANAKQKANRLKTFQQAILDCLSARQQERVKTHFRDKRDEKARRSLLQAFLEEFGDEVIIIKRKA
ncbi:MAG: hypothetical protein AAF597_09415 [Bacteroidota bacterium]